MAMPKTIGIIKVPCQ